MRHLFPGGTPSSFVSPLGQLALVRGSVSGRFGGYNWKYYNTGLYISLNLYQLEEGFL